MCKTSVIKMLWSLLEQAEKLSFGDQPFTTKQVQDSVEVETKVRPGEQWVENYLSEDYNLVDGLWSRRE